MVGSGKAANNGILFKTASSLEMAGKTQIIALDKTKTITSGEPEVTDVIGDNELLKIAYSLELKSEHPLAKAIVKFCEKSDVIAYETTDFKAFSGGGVSAQYNSEAIRGGNLQYISKYCTVSEELIIKARLLASNGKTPIFFAKEK